MQAFNLDKIKRDARTARQSTGEPITTFLNRFARGHGFHTWESFQRAQIPAGPVPPKSTVPAATDMNPYRKLLVLGLNAALERGVLSLHGKDEASSHLHVELAGHPSVVLWDSISHEELTLAVWWKYNHARHPQANLEGNAREEFLVPEPLAKRERYREFVGVVVSCWLERKTAKNLQGIGNEGLTMYTRRGELAMLAALPNPVPMGFVAEGRLFA